MKLQRENFYGSDVAGDWYSAADVDALLAAIREAVEAEREATAADAGGFRAGTGGNLASVYHAEADLDALLNEGA